MKTGSMPSNRPFKKFFCDRDDVFLMPDAAFKLWMFHYKSEGPSRLSWLLRETMCKKLNMSMWALKAGREWLIKNGWLQLIETKPSGIPVFRVTRGKVGMESIPATRYGKRTKGRYGKHTDPRYGKHTTEVDVREVDTI